MKEIAPTHLSHCEKLMADAFSVAMCTHNGVRFIGEQLESIAAQTLLPEELIVCDDASSDETLRLVESFATDAPFPVRIYLNETKLGLIKNFERVIGLCGAGLIALCDQDDVWMPHKLERLAVEFARAPEVGLVFSDAELIDENSRPLGRTLWKSLGFRHEKQKQLSQVGAFRELLTGSTVTGATMAFRARFRHLGLPIPEDLPLIHDAWLALIIGAAAEISSIPEPLVKYRQHGGQQIGARARQQPTPGVSNALRRSNPYLEMLAIARSAQQRLENRSGEFESKSAQQDLGGRIRHLEARAALPRNRFLRMPRVLSELFSLRYHYYSNGINSAFKDLLV